MEMATVAQLFFFEDYEMIDLCHIVYYDVVLRAPFGPDEGERYDEATLDFSTGELRLYREALPQFRRVWVRLVLAPEAPTKF